MRIRLWIYAGLLLGSTAWAQTPVAPTTASAPPAPTTALATDQPTLTIEEALKRFAQENLSLASARFGVSASRADTITAGLLPNPSVYVGWAALVHGTASGGTNELEVALSQPLPFAGQVGTKERAAEAWASAEERAFAAYAFSLSIQVRAAYLDLQMAQRNLRLIETAVTDLEKVQSIIDLRTSAGANSSYDRIRVTFERSALIGRRAQAATDLLHTKTDLAESIGKNTEPAGLVATELTTPSVSPPIDRAKLQEAAAKNRADLESASKRILAAQLRVEAAERSRIPTPEVRVGYNHGFRIPTDVGPRDGGMLGVGLTVPITVFDRAQGTIARGEAETSAARADRDKLALRVKRNVDTAIEALKIRSDALTTFRKSVTPEIEKMRQIAELSYREGRASVLELLDAYSTYLATRQRAVELEGAVSHAWLDLEEATGPKTP